MQGSNPDLRRLADFIFKYDSDSQKLPLHVLTAIDVVSYCFDRCLLLENTRHFEH